MRTRTPNPSSTALFLVSSAFTLAECIRDQQEETAADHAQLHAVRAA